MRAAVFHGPGDLRVEELPDPVAQPGDLVMRVSACGVCGSDVHAWRRGALVRPGQVLGHEFAGVVDEVGDGVEGVRPGDRVVAMPFAPCGTCRPCLTGRQGLCERAFRRSIANGLPGAFAERLHVPGAVVGATVHHLPDAVPDHVATLVEPLAVGIHAVEAGSPRRDGVAVVLGLGTIGLGVVAALRARGVEQVVALDHSPPRRAAASAAGATVASSLEDLEGLVRDLTGPGAYGAPADADTVYECSGAPPLLAAGIRLAGMGGRVVLVAIYGARPELDATQVVRRGIEVLGSFGYDGPEFPEAIAMLAEGHVDADAMVTHRVGLDRIDEAFALQADPTASVKVVVEPGARHG